MDKALKQRLVGATVLIALAVIVLPMLLGGRPDGSVTEPEKIELPQQPPELSFETRRYPIGDTADQETDSETTDASDRKTSPLPTPRIPATTDSGPPEEVTQIPVDEPLEITGIGDAPDEHSETIPAETDVADDTESSEIASNAQASPVESSSSPAAPGRYVVQVASFGAAANANRLSGQLQESGYSVLTDTVKSEVGVLHRVRVGPYETESEAKQTAVALGSSIQGVKPRIMDLQPEQSAQVTSPDDPLVRWVVQVGSFSSPENAENVVAKLRLQGMSAYQETVTSAGAEIFRVRVGPFLAREDAVTTEKTVNESLSVSAVVMSTD